ncbi:DUF167 domain-containing protein [Dechloromonas denitrificans]|uniref:DUF167 domain-containing protein n=1 Tax=Dechloromonas denitrificans TaxID=281362 RepID=UPI001CF82CC7|nr:DUF167 family protein [Dechloromonas denitrificans]UCV05703.1 DUF167 domain-containing protein [Dechloromonas denitrificans]
MKAKRSKPRHAAASSPDVPAMDSFCAWDGETLVLNILGQPNANRDAIGKPKGKQLQVSVTAAPVAGRATDHMVRFLAGEFAVSPAAVTVVFGRFNINKQLRIRAPQNLPAVVAKHLAQQPLQLEL